MLYHRLQRVKLFFLDLLFPLFCFGCGKEEAVLCITCRNTLKHTPPTCFVCRKITPFLGRERLLHKKSEMVLGKTCKTCRKRTAMYGFFSPFSYEDPLIRRLIHDLKYKRTHNIAPILAELLYESSKYYNICFRRDTVIIPIPLYRTRERFRGFNQSALVGFHLAPLLSCICVPSVLEKTKKTRPQVGLLGEDRRNNIRGSFAIKNTINMCGRTVILLDDVKTTGTTLEEAARILKNAGASHIWAMSIAH